MAERARQTPPGEWILGHGWTQHSWQEGFGNANLLDAVSPNNPVYLTAKSLHAGWCNNLALQQMGATADTPDPAGGRFGRDEKGTPDGILFESAMACIQDALPPQTVQRTAEAIQKAQMQLWQFGITGVHDFDGVRCFQALQQLQKANRLKLRVTKSIPVEQLTNTTELGLQTGFGDDFLRIGSVKLFADGALGPRTGAMLQAYENEPDNFGMLLLDQEEIFEYGMQAAASGLSLAIHAIGDRANHEVINGLERLREYETTRHFPHLRHRIEHVQITHPDDIKRIGQLGIVASMQPVHLSSDWRAADRCWGKRGENAFAMRDLLNAGTALAFGSDAPVESPNPFWGLHTAITRTSADKQPENGWFPNQKITLEEALCGFTAGAAYIAGMESCQGRIMPGYLADFVMLSHNLFTATASELYATLPLATMINGEWVWQRNE